MLADGDVGDRHGAVTVVGLALDGHVVRVVQLLRGDGNGGLDGAVGAAGELVVGGRRAGEGVLDGDGLALAGVLVVHGGADDAQAEVVG